MLGALFNRLPLEGYYSLQNCRTPVTQYFTQQRRAARPCPAQPHAAAAHTRTPRLLWRDSLAVRVSAAPMRTRITTCCCSRSSRTSLTSYQDYHVLLLTLAGRTRASSASSPRSPPLSAHPYRPGPVLGSWVGVRRLIHHSLFPTASRMVLPKILVLTAGRSPAA